MSVNTDENVMNNAVVQELPMKSDKIISSELGFNIVKRIVDIFGGVVGILALIPLTIGIAIAEIITGDGGPIIYSHQRIGKNGKLFKMYKYRSMVVGADDILKEYLEENEDAKKEYKINKKLKDDPRITKIGHFLRKTKLDEIPQLINVFIGQMSFVGPRPELQYYIDMYTDNEKPILDLKPGITDWASLVNMKQFEGFTNASDPDEYYLKQVRPLKLKLQLYYRYNHSFWNDIYCIIVTVLKVFTRSDKLPKDIQKIVDDYKNENKN